MATFNEWLFFEEIREEVYLGSLRRLAVQEAVREVMEFCGMAVAGRWDLIVENYEEDDDGPVPDYDPFADGDENAKPVELPAPREIASRIRRKKKKKGGGTVLPSELRSGRGDWTPPSDDDDPHASTKKRWQGLSVQDDLGGEESEIEKSKAELDIASGVDSSEIVKTAKRIQRLWFLTRWAAMLDRRDAIARVADIYRSEVAPVIGLEEWSHVREAYDDDFAPIKFDDDDDDDPKKTEEQKQRELDDAAVKLKPLLEKLGYLRDEHLSYENGTDFILERARMAMAEEGNDPPDEEEVQEMEKNHLIRTENRNKLFLEMYQLLEAAAKKQERRLSTIVRDNEGRSKESSAFDMYEILSSELLRAIDRITNREVLKDGTVKPWDDSINAFKIEVEDEESAERLLNSLKSSTSRGSFMRDKKRQDNKAAATRPSSKDAPVSMDAPVAGAEGEATTMAVADTKQRSAAEETAAGETGKILMDAFKQAMLELKEQHPDWAVLLCLWLGLQDPPSLCALKAGEISTQSIGRIRDAMMSVSLTSRDSRNNTLKQMGYANLAGSNDRGSAGIANWELVKAIKDNVPNPSGIMAKDMPPGDPPRDWTPIYTHRHTFDEEQKKWWKYTNRVINDLIKKVIPFVWERISQIMAERNEGELATGQESSCSWNLERFLKNAFRDELKSGGTAIEGAGPEWKLIQRLKDPKARRRSGNREIGSFGITLQDGGIRIVRNGWEGDSRFFNIPKRDMLCPKCGGAGGRCPECEGCGYIMNRLEAHKMERDISAYLTSRRKRRKSNI